jgi:hypothetical protein
MFVDKKITNVPFAVRLFTRADMPSTFTSLDACGLCLHSSSFVTAAHITATSMDKGQFQLDKSLDKYAIRLQPDAALLFPLLALQFASSTSSMRYL